MINICTTSLKGGFLISTVLNVSVFYYNNNYIGDILVHKYGMLNQLKYIHSESNMTKSLLP